MQYTAPRTPPYGGGEAPADTAGVLHLPGEAPGDPAEQLAESRSICAAVLRRYAGHLTQGHEGYFYAYMGYPIASEQAAAQAVSAALELASIFGPTYRFRAGIHTDIIVTGFDPALPDIIGTASGTAWRLCRLMRGGGIAVSEATAGLLRGQYALRALKSRGAGRKTGRSPAVPPAYRLLDERKRDARRSVPASAALIGRRAEMRHLKKLWRLACDGQPQFLVLRGEAGIGKTRLVRALRNEVARTAARVRDLHAYPEHRHTPLYPVIALIASLLGFSADDTPATQRRRLNDYLRSRHPAVADAYAPVLMSLLSIAPADAPVPSPRQRKEQTLDMLLLLFDSFAAGRPLLLIVEDAHWLDVTTLDLLERLPHRTGPAGLMTLVTARPAFDPAWLKPEAVVELPPLPDADIARLLRATDRSLASEAIDAIVQRAEGVPFYAEEMARLPGGVLDGGRGIPTTLRYLLSSRLDAVPQARRILQLAATVGRNFDQDLLRHLVPSNAEALAPVLQRLVDAHLISTLAPADSASAGPGGRFQFRHALIQEAAYESQLQSDREDAHRRIADALCRHYPQDAARQPAEIARHYTIGGQWQAAVDGWLNAGRQALAISAATEAGRPLREGLNLIERLPPGQARDTRELALLLLQAQAVQLSRGYGSPEAAGIYDRALQLSHEQLPARQRFEILWGLWTVSSSRPGHGFRQAREQARHLLELAGHSGDRERLAKAHTANANVALWLNQPDEVCRHARAAVEAGEGLRNTLGGLDAVSTCLAYVSWAGWRQGRVSDALEASRRSLARARLLNNPDSLCLALGFAAMLRRFLGDLPALAEHTRELQLLADAHQLATWQGLGRMLTAWAQARRGEEGGIAVLQASAQGIQAIMPSVAAIFLHALAEACGFLGRRDEQLEAIDRGLAAAAKVDERFFGSLLERLHRECSVAVEFRRPVE